MQPKIKETSYDDGFNANRKIPHWTRASYATDINVSKTRRKIYVAVADIEAYNTRTTDVNELRRTAIEEYITNYIALGLDPKIVRFIFRVNDQETQKS